MAVVFNNDLLDGLRGRVGRDLVFKRLRGKTIVSARAKPSNSDSVLQQATRSRFKEASAFAKAAMLDSERKTYYSKKAHQLKLPNAYTAALTDYLRKPVVMDVSNVNKKAVKLRVIKKDFHLRKADVVLKDNHGVVMETRTVTTKAGNALMIDLEERYYGMKILLRVEDEVGKWFEFEVG